MADSPVTQLQVGPPLPRGIRPPTPVNIRVTGIEVTQAVQVDHCGGCYGTLPSRNQLNRDQPGQATCQGVTMAQGKITVVRVYAHDDSGTLSGAIAQLDVLDDKGNRISTLSPQSSPAQLTTSSCPGICVNRPERANPGSSFNFVIPWILTNRDFLSFRATVNPPTGPSTGGLCLGCHGNVFTLYYVLFQPVSTVQIHPIPLTLGGVQTTVPASQVFAGAQTVFPVSLNIRDYDPVRPIDGLTNYNAALAVLDRGRMTTSHRANTRSECSSTAWVASRGTPSRRWTRRGGLTRRRSCPMPGDRSPPWRMSSGTGSGCSTPTPAATAPRTRTWAAWVRIPMGRLTAGGNAWNGNPNTR